MKRLIRSALVLSAVLSQLALAQEAELQVDDGEGGVQAGVQMQVQVPDVNVRVRTRQRTTTTVIQESSGPVVVQPQYVQPQTVVVAPVVVRDCGTGSDPGCALSRDGQYAMDAVAFRGFLEALRANHNELGRQELCQTTLAGNYLTAAQLGLVLDLFKNELTRLEVGKLAAARTVDPSHALGHAAKFRNSLLGTEYTEAMAAQR